MLKNLKEKFGFFEDGSRMAPLDYGDGNYSTSSEALKNHDRLPVQKHEESVNDKRCSKKPVVNDLRIIGLWILGISVFLIIFIIVLSKSLN